MDKKKRYHGNDDGDDVDVECYDIKESIFITNTLQLLSKKGWLWLWLWILYFLFSSYYFILLLEILLPILILLSSFVVVLASTKVFPVWNFIWFAPIIYHHVQNIRLSIILWYSGKGFPSLSIFHIFFVVQSTFVLGMDCEGMQQYGDWHDNCLSTVIGLF